MKSITYKSGDFALWVLGDTHIDHPNTDIKTLQRHIDMIQDSGAPWIHLGDWVDCINPLDKRFSVRDNREAIVDAYLKAEQMFNPIVDQGVAILRGNHGSKWSRIEGDMIRVMAKRWGIPYLGYCGFIKFRMPKRSYVLWVHHGAGGGRKRGAKAIRLQDWSGFVDADVYLQGHTHTYQNFVDEQVRFSSKRTRYFGNVPGYIRSYRGHDNYIEELGLPPQPIGMLQVEFGTGKREVEIQPVIE